MLICIPIVGGDANQCWCYYNCSALKTCEVGLGGLGCDNKQCERDCVAKYLGKGAFGFRCSIEPPEYYTCHCKYFC